MRIGRLCLAAGLLLCASGFSQEKPIRPPSIDVGAFAKEMMKLKIEGDQTQMGLWFPDEYFIQVGIQEGRSRERAEKQASFLAPYLTFAVVRSIARKDGPAEYRSEDELRAKVVLQLADGREIAPLKELPPRVSEEIALIKEGMAANGGASMEHASILLFPSRTPDGRSIIDISKRQKLTLVLKADQPFRDTPLVWYTPFDALAPANPCPKCREPLSAKWSYCPWCGAALSEATVKPPLSRRLAPPPCKS
jgi:hypothetical protein